MYKYSVIIPIYNASKTLERCLNSLLLQNYEKAEIILINDGSTDNSEDICKQFAQEYSQIKYIYQQNKGVSFARNRGLSVATGKYILFVDSDDYVSKDYFSEIDNLLKKHNADLTIFSQYDCKFDTTIEKKYNSFFTDSENEMITKLSDLICRKIINEPWTKIYKREIIKNYHVDFPVKAYIAEDRAFNIKYALHIKSLQVADCPLYYVSLDNENSLSRRKKEGFKEQSNIFWNDVNKAIADCQLSSTSKQHIINALNFGECRVVYTYAKMSWQAKDRRNVRIRKIKKVCDEINSRNYTYPKTKYCRLITFPVRFEIAWLIDVIAWKLTH